MCILYPATDSWIEYAGKERSMTDRGTKTFPLSLSQMNIWNLEQSYAGTSINAIGTTLRINGRVDFAMLQKTLNLVIEADPCLRTRIIVENGVPMQFNADYRPEVFPVYDFTGASEDGVRVWETTLTREPLPVIDAPLYRFVLFRTGEHSGGVFVKIHHIISDGWSQALICNRVAQTYFELLSGNPVSLEEAPGYDLHVQDEQEYLASRKYDSDRRYWEKQMADSAEASGIKDLKGAAVSPVGRRVSFDLPQQLNHAVYSFCIQNRVAPFAVFYMALAIYFKRTGGADRFTIGVPIFNRSSYLFKKCTGMFVSTLPFVNTIDENWTFAQFNEHLADAWFELLRHERFPFRDICSLAGNTDERLFHIALSYQDSRVYESHDTSVTFSGRWHYSGYQAEQLCIHMSNLDSPRQYTVDYDYLTQFYTEDEICALHYSLMNLLTEALANTEKPVCRLSMLGVNEREKVLYTFNHTAAYIGEENIWQVFSRKVREYPRRVALIHRSERLTYKALEEQAARVSAAIACSGKEGPGLAAILLPRDFSLFHAITGVMRAGWAYMLISEETPPLRALEIIRQSGAQLLISSRKSARLLEGVNLPVSMIDVDDLPAPSGDDPAAASTSDLAYVVYTSGSTGTPKGVEIPQKSLLNLSQAMGDVYGHGAVLSMCNVSFDAFVLESAAALLNGRTIVLPTDEELESPRRLAHLIVNYAVGFMACTPSRLYSLMKEKSFAQAIRGMSAIVCGGEAFPRELLQILSAHTRARIYNQYGPSEATVAVSHKVLNGTAAITAGSPLQNCRLYVLDEWKNPLPVGVYGELYIGGVCVGKGYRNDPELTAEKFTASPFESGERLYKTGDIACWTADGEIILAGRRDRQIKLRGLRIEPQEISACIASHPMVQDAAVRVAEISGQTVIAAYYTADRDIPEVDLLTHAAAYLQRYMIPSCVMRVDEIPLNKNGKLDESRLPLPDLSRATGPEAPADSLTARIVAIFGHALGEGCGADGDYFLHGGSSLSAMQTLAEIEEATGCLLRFSDLYACRTARRMAALIARRTGQELPEAACTPERIRKAPAMEYYPLSPVQRGIYFQSVLDETGVLYNMSGAFIPEGEIDFGRLENAFRRLIADDPIFRTCFVQHGGSIAARVEESVSFRLDKITGADLESVRRSFVMPFDLSRAPLLRASVWHAPDGRAWILMDSHHIIGDGLSTAIIMKRLSEYYAGGDPALPGLSYMDYSWHLNASAVRDADRQYWKNHLTPMPEALCLPTDAPRGHGLSFRGSNHSFALSEDMSRRIEDFVRENGVSAYCLFLAAFGWLIYNYSGKRLFTVGSPVTDRTRPELKEVCGPFINVLPMKIEIDPALSAMEYLRRIAAEVSATMDHALCAPDEIAQILSLPRDPARNPLYDVMLSMQPFDPGALELCGHRVECVPLGTPAAKTELGLDIGMAGGVYTVRMEYSADLYMPETIALLGRSLETIIRAMLDGSALPMRELDCLSLLDRMNLFDMPDRMTLPFLNLPVHEIARREALMRPDETAVIFHGETFTRMDLEMRACRIANALQNAGARRGDRVGLAMSRTPDLFAGMLAILKNGCAYVPLLTTLPENRLSYMAETAQMKIILTDKAAANALPEALRGMVVLPSGQEETSFSSVPVAPGDLINVLFTSGSTGNPKGVMIRHSSISNLLSNMTRALAGVTGPMICATTPVFDIFITESLLALAMGRTIVLADEEEMLLPWKLAELIEAHNAGFIQFTASRLTMCMGNEAFAHASRKLQFTIVGGEQVSPALVSKFKKYCPSGRLVNLYGPTEASVYVTMTDLQDGDHVTIGSPMGNCRVYVMDEAGRRLMPGAVGELCLAGAGVAAGYINRPDLTEASFVPDPFVPGEMMYKSGDLGRLRVDGRFDCCGRRDAQVKINGQRLEIDEIVTTMLKYEPVGQAVVIPVKDEVSGVRLHAFITRNSGSGSDDIVRYLSEYLPGYMVPSAFHILPAIPYTPGGKADLTLLKAMAESGNIPEKNLPASNSKPATPAEVSGSAEAGAETAAQPTSAPSFVDRNASKPEEEIPSSGEGAALSAGDILNIWKKALDRDDLREESSFFEQGGTSLGVLNVLSYYHNLGVNMSIAEFYRHPTPAAQAELLGEKACISSAGTDASVRPAPEAAQSESGAAEAVESACANGWFRETLPPRWIPEGRPIAAHPECVLLTGATGYFGAHLVRALLKKGTRRIYCLVRGGEERLTESLAWYFGEGWADGVCDRVQAVSGDIALPRMGLSETEYGRLAGDIQAIYHAAADVRHFVSDEEAFMSCNVGGTENAIELALSANAVLYYVSTLSVGGEHLLSDPYLSCEFSEADCDMGQNWRDNIYVRSKMLSEALICAAMKDKNLNARIYRLGRIVERASDGRFQRNPENSMSWMVMKGAGILGAIPADLADMPMDMTPVDYAAEAVAALSRCPMSCAHISHPMKKTLSRVAREAAPHIRIVAPEVFDEMMASSLARPDGNECVSLLGEWVRQCRLNPARITPVNRMTLRMLEAEGFEAPFKASAAPERRRSILIRVPKRRS